MNLDKFYTNEDVAAHCISLIPNIDKYDLIIEPAAGSGSFSKQIDCLAYDIEPEGNNIIKQNYLELQLANEFEKLLIIGNPPFGNRGKLAKAFILHSIELGASTIAFILPDTFNKLTNQSVFPKEWKLILVEKLEGTNFTVDGEEYYVPCSFYIWTKEDSNINLREVPVEQTSVFSFLKRGDLTADFVINGNSGKVKDVLDVTNSKSEHYIYVNNRNNVEKVRNFFATADYTFNSSVNGNNAWIGQQEILKYFYDHYI